MTNYEKYFGTPEKAAASIKRMNLRCAAGDAEFSCSICPHFMLCNWTEDNTQEYLAWLLSSEGSEGSEG